MGESNFVDSLPPGWTMKERIRFNGKRDKFYFAPENGPKFNSRLEVYRYLNEKRIQNHKPERKKKSSLSQTWKTIAVEKVKAEDLPQGWICKIRVSERNQVFRRDPYYIDPVTKSTFRSLKAVYRYLDCSSNSSDLDSDSYILNDDVTVARRTRSNTYLGQSAAMNSPIEELTPRRSKRLAGIQVDPAGLTPKTRAREYIKIKKSKKTEASNQSNLPMAELLLSDPCIAFAINVLTATSSDDSSYLVNLAVVDPKASQLGSQN